MTEDDVHSNGQVTDGEIEQWLELALAYRGIGNCECPDYERNFRIKDEIRNRLWGKLHERYKE